MSLLSEVNNGALETLLRNWSNYCQTFLRECFRGGNRRSALSVSSASRGGSRSWRQFHRNRRISAHLAAAVRQHKPEVYSAGGPAAASRQSCSLSREDETQTSSYGLTVKFVKRSRNKVGAKFSNGVQLLSTLSPRSRPVCLRLTTVFPRLRNPISHRDSRSAAKNAAFAEELAKIFTEPGECRSGAFGCNFQASPGRRDWQLAAGLRYTANND